MKITNNKDGTTTIEGTVEELISYTNATKPLITLGTPSCTHYHHYHTCPTQPLYPSYEPVITWKTPTDTTGIYIQDSNEPVTLNGGLSTDMDSSYIGRCEKAQLEAIATGKNVTIDNITFRPDGSSFIGREFYEGKDEY